MKEAFLNSSINMIEKYQKIDDDEREKILYGLEGLYLSITKMTIILTLAFILGILYEVIILLVFFNIIRFTGFGFHAKKSIECFLISSILFVLLPLLLLNININKLFIFIIGLLGTIYLLIYAPADTIKRPLPNKKKRVIRKTITVITSIIYLTIAININNYTISILLLSAIIVESVMVSPITYKLFGQPYRNYLNYKKA